MCKYCGKIVKRGHGPHGRYCSQECWREAEGFDCMLRHECAKGKLSIDAFEDAGGQIGDNGAAAEAMYDRLDGTEQDYNPKMDVAELMQKATDINPLLPAIISLIARGWTMDAIAAKLGISKGRVSQLNKELRASITMI